jgi:hypothetical protein
MILATLGAKAAVSPNVITPVVDPSFSKCRLAIADIKSACNCVQNTKYGRSLLKYVQDKSLVVTLYLVGTYADISEKGFSDGADGYCNPVIVGKSYDVYIACADKSPSFNSDGEEEMTVKAKPVRELARLLFHELLHALFITEYPHEGTGHLPGAYETVNLDGSVTYLEEKYDPGFVYLLKAFDRQLAC